MVKGKEITPVFSSRTKPQMNGSPPASSQTTGKCEPISANIFNSEKCFKLGSAVNTKDFAKPSTKGTLHNWLTFSNNKQTKPNKNIENKKPTFSKSPEKNELISKPVNGGLKVGTYLSSTWNDKAKLSNFSGAQSSPTKHDSSGLLHISRMKAQPALYRKMFGVFKEDSDVLARWSDGLYYLGTVRKVADFEHRCHVQFEDKSLCWVHFKDLQPICNRNDEDSTSDDETGSDMTCALCRDGKSDPPNEIVLCDKCGQGFHQLCHMPPIDTTVLNEEDETWQCRTCVFAAVARRGGADSEGPGALTLTLMKQVLPYDISSLTWDKGHKANVEEIYCYCGGPGDWYQKMLQCCRCQQWFHEACLQCLETPILYGDRFFLFVCSICNQGNEYVKRLPIRWVDVVHLVLYNITIAKKVKYYDYAGQIIPFFAQNWDSLQLGDLVHEASTRNQLKDRVFETLQNNKTKFQSGTENKKAKMSWGLRTRSPPVPPTVNIPPSRVINDELLKSLDLRHGSLLLSESPTPLKRDGPGEADGSEGSPPRKMLSKDPLEDWRLRAAPTNATNLDGGSYPGSKSDNIFDRLYNDAVPKNNESESSPRNSALTKRRRGRPRKDSTGGTSSSTPPLSRGRGRPANREATKHKSKELSKFKKGPSSFCSENSATIPISELFQDLPGTKSAETYSGRDVHDEDLRGAMARYFGAEGRIACGERFNVLAKRVLTGATSNGGEQRVEYLIEWEGYTAKQLHESVSKG